MRYVWGVWVLVWLIGIGGACFTAGLLIAPSSAQGGDYQEFVNIAAIVAGAGIVAGILLSIIMARRRRR